MTNKPSTATRDMMQAVISYVKSRFTNPMALVDGTNSHFFIGYNNEWPRALFVLSEDKTYFIMYISRDLDKKIDNTCPKYSYRSLADLDIIKAALGTILTLNKYEKVELPADDNRIILPKGNYYLMDHKYNIVDVFEKESYDQQFADNTSTIEEVRVEKEEFVVYDGNVPVFENGKIPIIYSLLRR